MDQDFKYDVYFSYSNKDKPTALELAERLNRDGVRVWIDEWGISPGDDWVRKIDEAIIQSRAMIMAISKNSLESPRVQDEWLTAFDNSQRDPRRRIIPLRLDDSALRGWLAKLSYVDWTGQSEDQYKRLLDACRPSAAEGGGTQPPGVSFVPQFWLISIDNYQYHWNPDDKHPLPSLIHWRQAVGSELRANVKLARPNDIVLAYWPEDTSVGGLGYVQSEFGADGTNQITIRLEHVFPTRLSYTQLASVVNVEELKPWSIEPLFAPLSKEEWSLIRSMILSLNSSTIDPDKFPPPYAPSVASAQMQRIELYDELVPGKYGNVKISFLNQCNFAWRRGDTFLISGDVYWQWPGFTYKKPFEWSARVESEVPTGTIWWLSDLKVQIPDDFPRGDLSQVLVEFEFDFESPYMETPLVWIKRRRAELPETNTSSGADSDVTQAQAGSMMKESPQSDFPPEIEMRLESQEENRADESPQSDFPPEIEIAYSAGGELAKSLYSDVRGEETVAPNVEAPASQNLAPPIAQQQQPPSPIIESKPESPASNGIQQSPASQPEFIPSAPPLAPLDLTPQAPIMLQRYEPLPDEVKIDITVSSKFVKLEYNDQEFNSPNRINQTALIELESEGKLRKYGEELFKAIINDEGTPIGGQGKTTLRGYSAAVNDDDARGKARISVTLDQGALDGTEGADLFDVWWEYLKDPLSDVPLSVSEKTPFYRLQGKRKSPGVVDALPLKILVAICNPITLGQIGTEVEKLAPLNIEQERDIIERALKRLKDAGLADYDIWSGMNGDKAVTLFNLQQKLEEGHHVLHLISHGAYSRKLGGYCLVMENDQREHDLVPAEDFTAPLLSENLRLVVLACCQSGDYTTGKALQSLGPRLIHLGAPAVIAMQDFVPIPAAQLFTQHFYDDLARSGRVDMAMAATRFALYSRYRGEKSDWAIPVLLMCNDDGKLFNVNRQRAAQMEELRPDVRTYNQLPGGDPTANKLARAFEVEARNQRMDEKTVGILREAVSAALRGQALRPESEPIAPQQDRRALSDIIKRKVRINPAELRQFVETSGSRLELPASVYRQAASALNTGKHVIFIGPPGTGKTSLANDICAFAKNEGFTTGVRPTTATAEWSVFDTVGGYIPAEDQTLQFRPGVFLRAICEAEWLVIDEINRAEIDKAFGELFTALSGQGVDLPYWVGAKQIRILPAEKDFDRWWDAGLGPKSYDYVMHPNWRIVAAMNAYDKSSLYALSFAFMRRFAFIDIDAPDAIGYHALLGRWADEFDPPLEAAERVPLMAAMQKLIARDNELMRRRALGPAILRDIVKHIGDRRAHDDQADLRDLLCEAFLLHAAPQLDGIERSGIFGIYRYLQDLFAEQKTSWEAVSARIRSLYPHITDTEWADGQNQNVP
jgi:TIR domain-containing protein/CHAT domain-containing protein/dynein-related subfamily AAA family protein